MKSTFKTQETFNKYFKARMELDVRIAELGFLLKYPGARKVIAGNPRQCDLDFIKGLTEGAKLSKNEPLAPPTNELAKALEERERRHARLRNPQPTIEQAFINHAAKAAHDALTLAASSPEDHGNVVALANSSNPGAKSSNGYDPSQIVMDSKDIADLKIALNNSEFKQAYASLDKEGRDVFNRELRNELNLYGRLRSGILVHVEAARSLAKSVEAGEAIKREQTKRRTSAFAAGPVLPNGSLNSEFLAEKRKQIMDDARFASWTALSDLMERPNYATWDYIEELQARKAELERQLLEQE